MTAPDGWRPDAPVRGSKLRFFAVDLDLAGLGPNLYLLEVQGGHRTLGEMDRKLIFD